MNYEPKQYYTIKWTQPYTQWVQPEEDLGDCKEAIAVIEYIKSL